jgi:K+-sensing histidine kinase KdpD
MSNFYFKICMHDGTVLHNSFPEPFLECTSPGIVRNVKVSFQGVDYKFASLKNDFGTVAAASNNRDHLKSNSAFLSKVNIILESIPSYIDIYSSAKIEANQHVRRLIHNLVTLNAHNIQEVYSIIPQDVMQNKSHGRRERIIAHVTNDPYEASLSLVRIAKNTLKMKTEIDVYNTLLTGNPALNKKNHQIHRLLMNVFYVFFPDFTDKGITVEVSESNDNVFVDYETFQVALYHIVENSVKYIKPESVLYVDISKNHLTKKVIIIFRMISLRIEPYEVDKIFIEGYSGEVAKRCNRAGSGIGMPRAKNLLEHNNALLTVRPKYETAQEAILGHIYQENVFSIEFK